MFNFIYFIGTGCGRPVLNKQLPAYLIGLDEKHCVLLECGSIINTEDNTYPMDIKNVEIIIITAADVELYAGLPSLLHSMRLLNRTKTLKIIAPKTLHQIIKKINVLDNYEKKFEIQYVSIEKHKSTVLFSNYIIHTKRALTKGNKFQLYISGKLDGKKATIFYTGKSNDSADEKLLIGRKYIIHDCTYSYDDNELTKKSGLSSYKNVLDFYKKFNPDVLFLVHFSTRYKNPVTDIMKNRIKPNNILSTYDGFRFDFLV
jgi:ribonuclease BN (tRNA processing enzyme)